MASSRLARLPRPERRVRTTSCRMATWRSSVTVKHHGSMRFLRSRVLRRALRAHFSVAWPEVVERGAEADELDLVMANADI